jgi:hypothetical protein
MTCFLEYSKSGNEEFLEGNYMSMNTKDSSDCGKGKVFLRRVTTTDFYKEPFLLKKEKAKNKTDKVVEAPLANSKKPENVSKPPIINRAGPIIKTKPDNFLITKEKKIESAAPSSLVLVPPPTLHEDKKLPSSTVIKPETNQIAINGERTLEEIPIPKVLISRANEVIKNLEINETQVTVKIFDNGTIDNDTVSVYLDKKLVISKQRLTAKPLLLSFEMSMEQKEHELVLVAENLGEIPPNTSLMVIQTPNKEYEVHVSSNEQKNAVIKFHFGKTP